MHRRKPVKDTRPLIDKCIEQIKAVINNSVDVSYSRDVDTVIRDWEMEATIGNITAYFVIDWYRQHKDMLKKLIAIRLLHDLYL